VISILRYSKAILTRVLNFETCIDMYDVQCIVYMYRVVLHFIEPIREPVMVTVNWY
jgi:hypothetical protein